MAQMEHHLLFLFPNPQPSEPIGEKKNNNKFGSLRPGISPLLEENVYLISLYWLAAVTQPTLFYILIFTGEIKTSKNQRCLHYCTYLMVCLVMFKNYSFLGIFLF